MGSLAKFSRQQDESASRSSHMFTVDRTPCPGVCWGGRGRLEEDDYDAHFLRAWAVELGLEAACILTAGK